MTDASPSRHSVSLSDAARETQDTCVEIVERQLDAYNASIALRLQLIPDWQLPDSLACRREDRVAQCRWNRRNAGFADASHRLTVVARNDVHADLARRRGHARYLVLMEVALLRSAVFEADLAQHRGRDTHDASTLHLRPDALRIDRRSAVDGDVHARDRQLALGIDRDFDDRGNVAYEAVVGGDTEA